MENGKKSTKKQKIVHMILVKILYITSKQSV